jgi:hypothetical protein
MNTKFKVGDRVHFKGGFNTPMGYVVTSVDVSYDLISEDAVQSQIIGAQEHALERFQDTYVKVICNGQNDGPSYILPRDTAGFTKCVVTLASEGKTFRVVIIES